MILISASSPGEADHFEACKATREMLDLASQQLSDDLGFDFRGRDIRTHLGTSANLALRAVLPPGANPGFEEILRSGGAFWACEEASRALNNQYFEEAFWLCQDEDQN